MSKKIQLFFLTLLFLGACKKESDTYSLQGFVMNIQNSQPLENVNVTIKKQVVQSGVFNNNFIAAANYTTSTDGSFYVNWPRENFAALRIVCEKNQFITVTKDLNLQNFTSHSYQTMSVQMNPEAFIHVRIRNLNITAPTDNFAFTFTNANFDCACCANGLKSFSGAEVDSTFECKLYGDTWLKYQKFIATSEADTILTDSIYCPSFQTTLLDITY